MKISTNQFKNGTKLLLIDNAPCSIVEHEFHKPGKGQAVMRVKYKNLLSGNTPMIKPLNLASLLKQLTSIIKTWSFLYTDGGQLALHGFFDLMSK